MRRADQGETVGDGMQPRMRLVVLLLTATAMRGELVQRFIDLDQVRVVQANNRKGNSRVYLEIMDQRILYSSPGQLLGNEILLHHVTEDESGRPVVDTDGLADMFRAQLGHILARLLLEARPDLLAGWSTDTDREI